MYVLSILGAQEYSDVTIPNNYSRPLGWLPHARARWLAEQVGAIVWQTATGEIVESRETWPNGTTGLAETPNNPAVFGWQRLTPS